MIPHPRTPKLKMVAVKSLDAEELRLANQKCGGLIFWDENEQVLERMSSLLQKFKLKFHEWKLDWINHLFGQNIRVWIEPHNLSVFLKEEEALYPKFITLLNFFIRNYLFYWN
jgi:hypothetical protein